jgi:hypothetical protein
MEKPIKQHLLILLTVCSTGASNFVELPRTPDRELPFTAWLLSSNDGFGHNYGVDEDNLRTYGINVGASFLTRWLVSIDATSFTDRNRAPRPDELRSPASRRIDELKLLGSFRWLSINRPQLFLSVYTGPGLLLYGNFGSLKLQESAHGINNEHTRPVPETYDAPSQSALGYLYAELYLPRLSVNVHSYAHFATPGNYNVDLSGGWWINKPTIQSSFTLSYKLNSVEHSGSAARNCYLRENGFWLSNKTLIGPLVVERGFNFNNLNQYSYVGFRFGDFWPVKTAPSPWRFSYSIGWPIGHNSWVEFFRLSPFADLPRLGFFLRTYHTENTFPNNVTLDDNDRRLRRTKETSLGAELTFSKEPAKSIVDAFAFGGAGFTRDMVSSYDMYEARFYETATSAMVHAGCGLRLSIPDFICRVYGRSLGAEIRINVRHNFSDTHIYSNPDLLLSWGLIFSEQ